MPKIEVTNEELGLILSALDSHAYWQLSDENYRDSGYVQEPGSDDPETAEEITAVEALTEKLEPLFTYEEPHYVVIQDA